MVTERNLEATSHHERIEGKIREINERRERENQKER
jgi:hypothetical protein